MLDGLFIGSYRISNKGTIISFAAKKMKHSKNKMAVWERLIKLDCSFMDVALGRDQEVQHKYDSLRHQPLFKSKAIAKITTLLSTSPAGYLLCMNDFPYKTDDDVDHLVFWFSDTELSMKDVKDIIIKIKEVSAKQVVVCCNIDRLKSMPEIHHYHVFLKEQCDRELKL
jgi:hypothetical protein